MRPALPYLLFDFDGTLADSAQAILQACNQLAPYFGLRQIPLSDLSYWQQQGGQAALRHVGLDNWKLPLFALCVKWRLRAQMRRLQTFAGLPEVLRALHARGYRMGILTSNTQKNVRLFLQAQGLEGLFGEIVGVPRLSGKAEALSRLLAQLEIPATQAYYIGDEVRDLKAARKAGMRAVAVSWGLNAPDLLAAQQPDLLLHAPRELGEVFGGEG